MEEVGEREADWSDDVSEVVLLSGSATDGSRMGVEEKWQGLQKGDPSSPLSVSVTSWWSSPNDLRPLRDPVTCILDTIDQHLAAIPAPHQSSTLLKRKNPVSTKSSSSSSHLKDCRKKQSDISTNPVGRYPWVTHTDKTHEISASADLNTDAVLTEDDAEARKRECDNFLADFDSLVVQQIDFRFQEIMCQKRAVSTQSPTLDLSPPVMLNSPPVRDTSHPAPVHTPPSPPPSAPPSPPPPPLSLTRQTSCGHVTDDSVLTEDFEHRFKALLIMTDGGNTSSGGSDSGRKSRGHKLGGKHGGEISGSVARARKALKSSPSGGRVAFKDTASMDEQGTGETTMENNLEKDLSRIAPLDTESRSPSSSPDRLSDRPRSMVIADAGMVPDYTSVDSASEEIERKSARIQRELQRERRARSVSPRRGVPVAAPSYSAALPPRSASAAPTTPRQVPVAVTPHMEFPSDPSAADNLGYHIENADKMILGQELKTLRGALFTTKLQIREAEKEAKHVKHRTEETSSELMLVEYKRATAHKDLDRLVDDLDRKRVMVDTYDMEIEAKQRELRGFQSIDITPEEAKLLHEENVGLNQRHRSLEVAHLETVELGNQLTSAKDDLLREQKQFRRQREQMVEEVETLRARLEESQKGWGLAQREVAVLEEAFGRMEQKKNDLIQEQSKEYTAFKMLARHESQENRQMLSHQVEVLNKELLQLQVRVTDLQADLKAKDEHSLKLSKQLTTLTQELTAEQSARAAEPEKHRQTLQRLRKETDNAMLKLKESLFLDKQRALENLRTEIERERKDNSSRSDERVAQMLAENAQLLSEKNGEITRLQERLKEMQETNRAAERRMQKKVDLQIREAVSRERAAMEKETQWKLQNERENLARDTKQRVNEMQLTLDHEREASQRMTREMAQLKEELEEQRRLNREAAKEKLVAVARAKDQIRDQSNAELENMRQKVKQEMQLEVDRLQSQLRSTEEELGTLRAENQRLMGRERDNLHSLDYTEKTVISELNQECRRSASVLGVSPRQVSLSAVTDSASGRSQINAALANLRAVNEELRKHIEELTSELDSCRAMITTMEKEKEHTQELASVAQASTHQSLQTSMVVALRRKEDEIAQLQDALTACRAESTDDKHALVLRNDEMKQELEKYQQRLRHSSSEQKRISQTQEREIARLETHVDRLALTYSSTNWNHHSLSPTTTHHHHHPQHQQHQHHQQHHHPQHQQQRQQQYLQARIQQLHHENNTLRRKHLLSKNSLSTSDLPVTCASPSFPTSPSPVTTLLTGGDTDLMTTDRTSNGTNICRTVAEIPGLGGYLLPKHAGGKGEIGEGQEASKRPLVHHNKLAEMHRLENTLCDQNQELMRLEQAYNQLHHHYNSSPSLALASILNNSH